MTRPERPYRLHMLLSEKEQGMLNELAGDEEITISECIRKLLKEAYAQRQERRPKK